MVEKKFPLWVAKDYFCADCGPPGAVITDANGVFIATTSRQAAQVLVDRFNDVVTALADARAVAAQRSTTC